MSILPGLDDVYAFWLGQAISDVDAARERNKMWFSKSELTDAELTLRFSALLTHLADGAAENWAARGPQPRLAAIIVLDQFSRNIYRGRPGAFAQDHLAHQLASTGLRVGDDRGLSEVERIFFYLPFEHAESLADQDRAVALFTKLVDEARPAFKSLCENTLDYAHKHREVIAQFGRFPHRNAILGRPSTQAEKAYLAKPGAGF